MRTHEGLDRDDAPSQHLRTIPTDARRSGLYSRDQITQCLPFSIVKTITVLLWLLISYNLLFLACAIEGTVLEWNHVSQPVVLMFALITVPLTLLILSSLDLHQWRQSRLRPKRIVFTATSAFVLLLIILAVLGPCYFRLTLETQYRCPNGLREMWAIWYYYHEKNDLAPTVPFLAAFNMIFYVIYFALGLVALSRDRDIEQFKNEPNASDGPDNLPQWLERSDSALKPLGMKTYWPKFLQRNRERSALDLELPAHPKHEGSRPQSQAASINISGSGGSRSQEDSQSHPSSLVNSSVAVVSVYATSTIQPSSEGSTNASSSLVNPDSSRSSAVISSASSGLPAYSE